MTYTPARSKHYADSAKAEALNEYNKNNCALIPYPQPVKVTLEFILRRKRTTTPDIANLVVQMLDTLEGVAYDNDSQVVEVRAVQKKGKFPMTKVNIEEV